MQNTMVRMTRAIVVALGFVWLGTMPSLAQGNPCTNMSAAETEELLSEVREVIKSKDDINKRMSGGFTALHIVSACSENDVVIALLHAGAKVDAKDKELGFTPLHMAAVANTDPEVITTLILAGADVHARTKGGQIPLHVAARANQNPKVIMTLLRAGSFGGLIDENGKTPFDYAEENRAIKGTDAYWALNDAQ